MGWQPIRISVCTVADLDPMHSCRSSSSGHHLLRDTTDPLFQFRRALLIIQDRVSNVRGEGPLIEKLTFEVVVSRLQILQPGPEIIHLPP